MKLTMLAIPVAFLLMIGAGLLRPQVADPAIADGYHARVLDLVERIPLDHGQWIGRDVALPPAAMNLLKPNAILAREYFHRGREIHATLLVVQCRDIRDMAGHYPPVCYPAHGWKGSEHSQGIRTVHGELMKPYVFDRDTGEMTHTITVYNIFALPTGETSVSMEHVRSIGSDYQFRPYGAAQVQVVVDETVRSEDHQWILDQMLSLAQPMIEAVTDSHAQKSGGQPE